MPKFGNDIPEVDAFARDVAYTYTEPLQNYKNPRGGSFQAGLYPVSANVPLGAQTGATPDGRLAYQPVADGVSPSAEKKSMVRQQAANSVSRLESLSLHQTVPYLIRNSILLHSAEEMDWRTL